MKHASKLYNLSRLHQGLQPADKGSVNLLEMSDCVCACHEGLWRSERTIPLILYFGTRQRCVVSFTSQPLYLREICCVRLIFNYIKMHFHTRHSTKIIAYLISCYGHSEFAINYRYVKLLALTVSYRWFYYGAMSNTLVFTAFYFALLLSIAVTRHLKLMVQHQKLFIWREFWSYRMLHGVGHRT